MITMLARSRSRTPGQRPTGYRQKLAVVHGAPGSVVHRSSPPRPTRFRTHAATKFITNKMSAHEAQQMAMLATDDGCKGAEDIAKAGKRGQAYKNSARDIKTLVLNNCEAPVPYMVTIPIWNTNTGSKEYVDWPVLLPHEMLGYLVDSGSCTIQDMADMDGRDDITIKDRKATFCTAHGLRSSTCIPLGFHGDGVPMQKGTHNQQTTEVYSWNLLCDKDGKRYLYTNIHKKFMCDCGCRGRCTLDPLLEVFAWSMQVLLGGRHPSVSHDGTKLDAARSAKCNTPLGFTGGLMQARGDWQFYNAVFSFPAWNSGQMCWKCRASQEGRNAYWKCGPTAAWRSTRYTRGEFLDNLIAQGVTINPLFTCPGFTIDDVCIGRLHAMDLGVSEEVLETYFGRLCCISGCQAGTKRQGFKACGSESRLTMLSQSPQVSYRSSQKPW